VLIISPLHSVTTPTVGVGYLASSLKSEGIDCHILDLNIRLKRLLEHHGVSREWQEWIFPYGERTFGGELLLSQACFGRSTDEILSCARSIRNKNFQDFFRRLDPEPRLRSDESTRIRLLIRSYLESCAAEIAEAARDWVGFSVVVTNQLAVIFLMREIHRRRPDLRIALGGPHFNRDNALFWAHAFPEADAIIVGEARSALASWVRRNEEEFRDQIIRRDSGDHPILVAPRDSVAWQAADWSDINWETYLNVTEDLQTLNPDDGGAVPVLGARGCSYNRCTFCYEVLLAPRYQPRDVDQVVEEICQQRKVTGRSDFFLTDLDLNSDYKRTLDLAHKIRQRAGGIRFHCWLRAHELDEETLSALYDAGARSWFVGVEAVTNNLLTLIRKGYDGQHARKTIALMARFAEKKRDVRYGFNLIPNYPGETVEDVLETFEVIRQSRDHYYGRTGALYEFTLTVNSIAWINRYKMGLRNFEGWNSISMPSDLADRLPSHVYWYDRDDETGMKRRLIWDHIRVLIGHEPRYIEFGAA
jgi:hypothetical protein